MARVDSPSVRYDWFQTDAHIVITVLLRNLRPTNVQVQITEKKVLFSAQLHEVQDYKLDLNLAHSVISSESSWKQYPSKVEIKLKKADGFRWATLEDLTQNSAPSESSARSKDLGHNYPSSCAYKRDWDKIATDIAKSEEEEEKNAQGEDAVNKLFQKIYNEGSEDVRRAMNKSFMESGGTVLSTNWKEVSKETVSVKPPDGMEFKKWET